MIEGLKKEISVENINSKFKSLEQWDDFRMTEEYITFSRYLNEEHEETVVFLATFKQEIQSLMAEVNDENLKTQLLSTTVDPKYISKLLLEYAENTNVAALDKFSKKEESTGKKMLIHANEVLDCLSLDEFFEKILIESTMNLTEQSYFTLVRTYSKEKLQDMVQGKISLAKRKN